MDRKSPLFANIVYFSLYWQRFSGAVAQFSEDENPAALLHVGRTNDHRVAYRRPAAGVTQIGTTKADGHHGTVLSHPPDRMELGTAQVHAQD